jgi:hypothetical protein
MSEPARKRRRKPKPLRFAQISVGDILIHHRNTIDAIRRPRMVEVANDDPPDPIYVPAIATSFAIVTDLWFDPVLGDQEPATGQMVGLKYYIEGAARGSKWSYNRLGLARKGWHFATPDQIADQAGELERQRAVRAAIADGSASPIRTIDPYR